MLLRLLLLPLLLVLAGCPWPKPDPDAVSAVLGPEGGTLSHPSGAVLVVPPGALAAPVSLSLAATDAPSAGDLRATPLGPAFLLGPEGQGFARPVQLTLPFDPARVPSGAGAPRIFTAPRDSSAFVQLESAVAASTVTAETLHFSTFIAAAPAFASTLSIATTSPLPGAAVSAAYGPVSLLATGGSPPYTWLLSWGALPLGINLSTTADGRGELQGLPGIAGSYAFSVRVSDSAGQVTEKPFELLVSATAGVSITGVVPPQILVRSSDTLITVTGTGFAAGSAVTLDGATLATSFVSATSLSAIVPAASLTTVGSRQVRVSNALLGGEVSAPFSLLVINGPPSLTSLSPAEIPAGHPTLTVTLRGANLGAGGQVYLGAVALPTQVVSPTEAVITLNANYLVNPGTFSLTFVNPAPGGGTSAPLPLRVVTLPPPTVLAPTPAGFPNHITQGHLTVDDVSVYWTDLTAGTVSRVAINGGPVSPLDTPDSTARPLGISVGRCNVYWVRGGNTITRRPAEVMSAPVNGGSPAGRLASVGGELHLVRHDRATEQLFWSTGPDVSDLLYRAAAAGGTPVEIFGGTWLQDFDFDDTHLYVVSRGTGGAQFFDGAVMRMAKDGSAGVWLATSQREPRYLAVGADRIYWSLADGEIRSSAKSGVGGVSTVLRTGESLSSLALDSSYLYWTTEHDVRALPLGGGAVLILASATNSGPHALEVDGAYLYWLTRSGQVMRLPKPGGTGGPPATGACAGNPGQSFPVQLSTVGGFGGLVSDGSFIYWSDGAGSGQGHIYKAPVAGGATTTLASGQDQPFLIRLYNGQLYWPNLYSGVMTMPTSGATPAVRLWGTNNMADLAVDSSGVWWVSANTSQLFHNGQAVSTYSGDPPTALALDDTYVYTTRFATNISRQLKSGGASARIIVDDASPASLVSSGGYLYWITIDTRSIKRAPVAGGPPETLASDQSVARSLVVDGADVYWITDGSYQAPKTGRIKLLRGGAGAPITLAEGQPFPSAIAVDAQYVYWLNGGTTGAPGGVMRLARSALP